MVSEVQVEELCPQTPSLGGPEPIVRCLEQLPLRPSRPSYPERPFPLTLLVQRAVLLLLRRLQASLQLNALTHNHTSAACACDRA